jgi:beta-glucanase (GH16 family)
MQSPHPQCVSSAASCKTWFLIIWTGSCPSDPALSSTITTDFTKGASSDWTLEDGTTMSYDGTLGAEFVIKVLTDAPTISSAKYIFFGKVSATVRASAGTGTVSSFILESDDLDEIDWEWLGSTDSSVESNFFGKGNTTTYDRAVYHNVATPVETFHVYTVDWTAQAIKWYIDGNLVRTLAYDDPLALGGKNYPQTPMRIKMGNWVGCASVEATTDPKTQGTCEWAGGAIDMSQAPFTMYVQSVTIEDYGSGCEYTYGDMSGSYQSIVASGTCTNSNAGGDSSSSIVSSSSTLPSSSSHADSSSTVSAKSSSSTPTGSSSTTSAGSSSATSGSSSHSSVVSGVTTVTTTASATSGSATVAAVATTASSAPAQSTSSDGNALKPKHKYGTIDGVVMVLGLGLGYLVM